jgi:hypothetical protein
MAAASLAVVVSRALKTFESCEPIPHEDIARMEQKAKGLAGSYQSPTQS